MTCLECGSTKALLGINYAGVVMRGGTTMPGDGSTDFLCGSCARDLQSRGLADNAGLKKPRQLVFRDLDVSQDEVCEEVLNFLAMKRYLNPKVEPTT